MHLFDCKLEHIGAKQGCSALFGSNMQHTNGKLQSTFASFIEAIRANTSFFNSCDDRYLSAHGMHSDFGRNVPVVHVAECQHSACNMQTSHEMC